MLTSSLRPRAKWESNPTSLMSNRRPLPMHSPFYAASTHETCFNTIEIRWDVLESNQPSHPVSEGRITRCQHPLSQVYCASPHDLTHVWAFCAKLKRSFSKAIYHILGANWSITPNDGLSFNMKCGVQPRLLQTNRRLLVGFLPNPCFLHHRAIRLAFDSIVFPLVNHSLPIVSLKI